MWTLRRSSDEYQLPDAESESPLLEFITFVAAVLAVIGVVALCACPFLATVQATPGDMQRTGANHAANVYPFLAAFRTAPEIDARSSGYRLLRVATAAGANSATHTTSQRPMSALRRNLNAGH